MSKSEIAKLFNRAMPVKSKYHAQPVVIDGHRFDSRKEGARYLELKALEKAGEIRDLELQPRFELFVAPQRGNIPAQREGAIIVSIGISIGFYVADFSYQETKPFGEKVVEDVKSPATRTDLYKLKKKAVEACHDITITEV